MSAFPSLFRSPVATYLAATGMNTGGAKRMVGSCADDRVTNRIEKTNERSAFDKKAEGEWILWPTGPPGSDWFLGGLAHDPDAATPSLPTPEKGENPE